MKLIMLALVLALGISISAFANLSSTGVCNEIHQGAANNITEKCVSDFEAFKEEQVLLAMGELAKDTLKANKSVSSLVLNLAVSTALTAYEEGRMYANHNPESIDLRALEYGTGAGVTCERAYDYEIDDYDPPVKKGYFSCAIEMETRVIYLTNTCNDVGDTSEKLWNQAQEQIIIDFEMREDGTIDTSTLSTKPFELVRSCAG